MQGVCTLMYLYGVYELLSRREIIEGFQNLCVIQILP